MLTLVDETEIFRGSKGFSLIGPPQNSLIGPPQNLTKRPTKPTQTTKNVRIRGK